MLNRWCATLLRRPLSCNQWFSRIPDPSCIGYGAVNKRAAKIVLQYNIWRLETCLVAPIHSLGSRRRTSRRAQTKLHKEKLHWDIWISLLQRCDKSQARASNSLCTWIRFIVQPKDVNFRDPAMSLPSRSWNVSPGPLYSVAQVSGGIFRYSCFNTEFLTIPELGGT